MAKGITTIKGHPNITGGSAKTPSISGGVGGGLNAIKGHPNITGGKGSIVNITGIQNAGSEKNMKPVSATTPVNKAKRK